MRSRLSYSYTVVALLAVFSERTAAAVVLTIDPTDMASVSFEATLSPAEINDATSDFEAGITLLGLFASDFVVDLAFSGNLRASGGRSYEDALTGVGSATLRDLNLYNDNASATQAFSTSAPALRGVALINLTGASIPAGSRGDIIVGDTDDGSGEVLGQWRSIPEPSAIVLVGVGVLLIGARRQKMSNKWMQVLNQGVNAIVSSALPEG